MCARSAALCTSCSLVQESREIEEEEQALRAAGGPAPETFYRDEEAEVEAVPVVAAPVVATKQTRDQV